MMVSFISFPHRRTILLAVLLIVSIALSWNLLLKSNSMADSLTKAELRDDRNLYSLTQYVSGLENPWGMAFLPTGEILVTEKRGEIRIIKNGKLLEKTIEGLPPIFARGQGGLLDIVLDPNFESNSFLYLSYSAPDETGNKGNTAILKAKLLEYTLQESKVLYRATPSTSAQQHFGSRIAFGNDGYLYFSIGDRGARDRNPQDINRDGGKIYRIATDGSIPDDNPFLESEKPAVFSYGHRNPQGLAFHPTTMELWSHEHGPRGGDELNIVRSGKNYGWPLITYGINYSGTRITDDTQLPGMEQPITYWVPSIAPCGMAFVTSELYPELKGDLLLGSLRFQHLVHIKLKGSKILWQEIIASGIGRVRNVAQGRDGYIYVAVEGKGLFRLMP